MRHGNVPLTLILGSGFSVPLIPTVNEMVRRDIAMWLYVAENGGLDNLYERKEKHPDYKSHLAGIDARGREFWERVASAAKPKITIELDADGLPRAGVDAANAYAAAMSDHCGGLYQPAQRRAYLRAAINRAGKRINGAHLFLAALLSDCARSGGHVCRTIFTTNFDPLLQRALSVAGLSYMVSDRPDVLESPDDEHGVDVHLVYIHGTAARYRLLNSDEELREGAERNASNLLPYLKKHPVLVVGYGGWDDALMRALQGVDQFDRWLVWCGREAEPSQLPERVQKLLGKSAVNAHYVRIESADKAMAELHLALTDQAIPMPLRDVLQYAQDTLKDFDLTGIKLSKPRKSEEPGGGGGGGGGVGDISATPDQIRETTSSAEDTLDLQEELERRRKELAGFQRLLQEGPVDTEALTKKQLAQTAFDRSAAHYFAGRYDKAEPLLTEAIESRGLEPPELALAIFRRGFVHIQNNNTADAIADYTRVIDLRGAPVEQVAMALFNRGVVHVHNNSTAEAIADFTRVIGLPGALVEHVAKALVERGEVHARNNSMAEAFADYKRVIELPGAPAEHVASALFNRGVAHARHNNTAGAIADFTRVIELPGAPTENVASALFNRGVVYAQNQALPKAIADFTRAIELPGATVNHVAKALFNRGVVHVQNNSTADAIADYTRVVELPGAPVEQVAKSLVNRGVVHVQNNNTADAIADYTRVIELPGATAEQVAKAQRNLGRLQQP